MCGNCSLSSSDNEMNIPIFSVESIIPSGVSGVFYRYDGSLTTPTCDESVIWSVFKDHAEISAVQVRIFQQCLSRYWIRKVLVLLRLSVVNRLCSFITSKWNHWYIPCLEQSNFAFYVHRLYLTQCLWCFTFEDARLSLHRLFMAYIMN